MMLFFQPHANEFRFYYDRTYCGVLVVVVAVAVEKENRCLRVAAADSRLDVNESAFSNGEHNLLLYTALMIQKL